MVGVSDRERSARSARISCTYYTDSCEHTARARTSENHTLPHAHLHHLAQRTRLHSPRACDVHCLQPTRRQASRRLRAARSRPDQTRPDQTRPDHTRPGPRQQQRRKTIAASLHSCAPALRIAAARELSSASGRGATPQLECVRRCRSTFADNPGPARGRPPAVATQLLAACVRTARAVRRVPAATLRVLFPPSPVPAPLPPAAALCRSATRHNSLRQLSSKLPAARPRPPRRALRVAAHRQVRRAHKGSGDPPAR